MKNGELILYRTEDGTTAISLRAEDGTVWLTQAEISELFQTTPQNITLHIQAIYEEGELVEGATCKERLQVREEGGRSVQRTVKSYNLDMILAIGYRVRSPRGTQFRQWATVHLREFAVKGFVMDDARLKQPGGIDYFDELLARIREIRASEKRFYQKVRDIFATAVDYDGKSEAAHDFFKIVQNKMLYAATGHTAAEIIRARANPALPNMGLKSWSGGKVHKQDTLVAKNYLEGKELDDLNLIVSAYLEFAELMARSRQTMTMQAWAMKLDEFLKLNERPVLNHAGSVKHDDAVKMAGERYAQFDAARRSAEEMELDREEMKALEEVEKKVLPKKRKGVVK